ncbi:hypothetical protein HZQ82_16640 [Elizabethkingia anophelis]|nr:hypothetical protein [Elizabethkingia anophelis]
MKNYTSFFILCFGFIYSQSNKLTPSIVPTTPESFAFNKISNTDIDFISGKDNISIPIYTIKNKDIEIPLTLNYSTGGIRLNEIASNVGLGWTLNTKNKITKNTKGKDDDFYTIWKPSENEILNFQQEFLETDPLFQKIKEATDVYSNKDTQSDIYSYNLPTSSGTFFFDKNNRSHTIPYQNDKIEKDVINNSITIKDTKGNIYTFKKGDEISTQVSDYIGLDGTPPPVSFSRTSYILENIRTPSNNLVKYSYRPVNYATNSYYKDVRIPITMPGDMTNVPYNDRNPVSKSYTTTNVTTENYISQIDFENGKIIFEYSDNNNLINNKAFRLDLKGIDESLTSTSPVALKFIKIYNQAGQLIKNFEFNYNYFISNNAIESPEKYRLKLLSIVELLSNEKHSFEYYENYNMPSRNSNSHDYWGYFNNKQNNTSIPNISASSEISQPYYYPYGGDLNVDEAASETYSLKKITYPTGGSKQYNYESNTIFSQEILTIPVIKDSENLFAPPSDSYLFYTSNIVNIPTSVPANKMKLVFNNNCENSNSSNAEINNTFGFGKLIHINADNSETILANNIFKNEEIDMSFYANKISTNRFKFEIEKMGDCSCNIFIRYTSEETSNNTSNFKVGGLRVKQIDFSDITSNYYTKYYYTVPDINTPQNLTNISSGINYVNNNFISKSITPYPLMNNEYSDSNTATHYTITNNIFSGISNTLESVKYNNVRVVTENKGFTDYQFNIPQNMIGNFNIYENFRSVDEDWKYTLLTSKKIYNNDSKLQSSTVYEYAYDTVKNSLSANSREGFINFDISLSPYVYGTGSIYTKYKVNYKLSNYANSFIKNIKETTSNYFSSGHIQDIISREYNSNINDPLVLKDETNNLGGTKQKKSYTYPFETGVLKLVNANILNPLFSSTSNVTDNGEKIISKSESKYDDPNNLFPTSVLLYDLQNNLGQTELTYDLYDNKGNILQYSVKGKPVTVIWGYGQTQPIAKIEGAAYNQVSAYVSAIIAASDADNTQGTDQSEQALIGTLDILRNNTALSTYQITTYTYNPLIGVTSITPPSGIREIYKYDSANRLESVKDVNGNLLKEYQYRYKN